MRLLHIMRVLRYLVQVVVLSSKKATVCETSYYRLVGGEPPYYFSLYIGFQSCQAIYTALYRGTALYSYTALLGDHDCTAHSRNLFIGQIHKIVTSQFWRYSYSTVHSGGRGLRAVPVLVEDMLLVLLIIVGSTNLARAY